MNRDIDGVPLAPRRRSAPSAEEIRGPRSSHCHGVKIHARDMTRCPVECLGVALPGSLGCREIPANGVKDECAGSASDVSYTLIERLRYRSFNNLASQPVRRVILAHTLTGIRVDDALVKMFQYVMLHMRPCVLATRRTTSRRNESPPGVSVTHREEVGLHRRPGHRLRGILRLPVARPDLGLS